MTLDADVALPATLPSRTPTIRDALVANGFEEEFRGDDTPPATHYYLGDSHSGFYAEFLTPLTGSEHTRTGKRKATAHIGGVNSQQLRFIELLLNSPWTVDLPANDFGLPAAKTVRVASPVGYLAQKLLIHQKRSPQDRAKDLLYVHDTLQLFGPRLDDLRSEWREQIRPCLHANAARTIETAHKRLFGELSSGIRAAAAMAAGRNLTAESLRASCHYGLQQLTD